MVQRKWTLKHISFTLQNIELKMDWRLYYWFETVSLLEENMSEIFQDKDPGNDFMEKI